MAELLPSTQFLSLPTTINPNQKIVVVSFDGLDFGIAKHETDQWLLDRMKFHTQNIQSFNHESCFWDALSYLTKIHVVSLVQSLMERSRTRVDSLDVRVIAIRLGRIFPEGIVIFHITQGLVYRFCGDGKINRYTYVQALRYLKQSHAFVITMMYVLGHFFPFRVERVRGIRR